MNWGRPSRYGGEEGSAAAEAGVIMSVLLLLIVGSIEFGRAFWTYNTMLFAVEEAGRYAMTYNHRAALTCKPQSQASKLPHPVEYAARRLRRLAGPADLIRLSGSERRRFRDGGHLIIPDHDNRLCELFLGLYRAATSSIWAASSHEPSHHSADRSTGTDVNLQRPQMTDSPHCATAPSEIIRSGFAQLKQSSTYDLLMRLPMLAWSSALALISAVGLYQYVRDADPALPSAVYSVNIAMRLSVIGYLAILATVVIMRRQPIGKARGVEPRISALIGTFLITAVVLFPRYELSLPLGVASTFLILAGDGFAVVALIQLRRSFSIMPEARELVTSGPYRFVRHPIYLAEEIATIGSVMQFLSGWTAMLLVVQIAFQLRRIWNEEALLAEVFPQYATYKGKTARVVPGIY